MGWRCAGLALALEGFDDDHIPVAARAWRPYVIRFGPRVGCCGRCDPDGPINRNAFVAYVRHVLVPDLSPGDIVIMDNLSSHKVATLPRSRCR